MNIADLVGSIIIGVLILFCYFDIKRNQFIMFSTLNEIKKSVNNHKEEDHILTKDTNLKTSFIEKMIVAINTLLTTLSMGGGISSDMSMSSPATQQSQEDVKKMADVLQTLIQKITADPNYKTESSKEDIEKLVSFFKTELNGGLPNRPNLLDETEPIEDQDDFDLDVDDEDDDPEPWKKK